MLVRVDVGLVRDVVPLPFEEPHEVVLGLERALRGVRQRPVEGHAHRVDPVRAVEVVEALPGPRVVRLPRVDGHLDEDLRVVRRRLAHDERDPAARVVVVPRARDAEERVVVPRRRRLGNREGVRDGPVGAKPVHGAVGLRPLVAAAARKATEQTRAEPAVPTQAVELDAVRLARARPDVQVDCLSRQDADLGAVAGDARRRVRRLDPGRGVGPRLSVLDLDRIRRGARGERACGQDCSDADTHAATVRRGCNETFNGRVSAGLAAAAAASSPSSGARPQGESGRPRRPVRRSRRATHQPCRRGGRPAGAREPRTCRRPSHRIATRACRASGARATRR